MPSSAALLPADPLVKVLADDVHRLVVAPRQRRTAPPPRSGRGLPERVADERRSDDPQRLPTKIVLAACSARCSGGVTVREAEVLDDETGSVVLSQCDVVQVCRWSQVSAEDAALPSAEGDEGVLLRMHATPVLFAVRRIPRPDRSDPQRNRFRRGQRLRTSTRDVQLRGVPRSTDAGMRGVDGPRRRGTPTRRRWRVTR